MVVCVAPLWKRRIEVQVLRQLAEQSFSFLRRRLVWLSSYSSYRLAWAPGCAGRGHGRTCGLEPAPRQLVRDRGA